MCIRDRPDIAAQLSELENETNLTDEERLAKKDELLTNYAIKAERKLKEMEKRVLFAQKQRDDALDKVKELLMNMKERCRSRMCTLRVSFVTSWDVRCPSPSAILPTRWNYADPDGGISGGAQAGRVNGARLFPARGPAERGGALRRTSVFAEAKTLAQAEFISAEQVDQRGAPPDGRSGGATRKRCAPWGPCRSRRTLARRQAFRSATAAKRRHLARRWHFWRCSSWTSK